MDKKTVAIILAVLLIVAFFLPYVSFQEFKLSGFKIIFGKGGLFGGKAIHMYLILLIPIGAILALVNALGADKSSSNYGVWMPLVGIIYLSVMMYLEMNKGANRVGGSLSFSQFMSVLGIGYWMTLVGSVLLLGNNARKE